MKIKLIGAGDHQGVEHVGGRVGAAKGPESFQVFFNKLNGNAVLEELKSSFEHLSFSGSDLEEKHQATAKKISQCFENQNVPILIGGGHDFAYSHIKGLKDAQKGSVACINIDPHLDLRPYEEKFTSGSPFRRLIEENILKPNQLIEFGIQKQANAQALFDYADEKGIKVVAYEDFDRLDVFDLFRQQLIELKNKADYICISLDLDAIQAAFAPGVSAPAAEGFSPKDIRKFLQIAAEEQQVISLGIYELNPSLDLDHRTARLAAYLAYTFIEGKIEK
ncbi:MAG: formimidoylglutamase [Flavobacteriales bacterium]